MSRTFRTHKSKRTVKHPAKRPSDPLKSHKQRRTNERQALRKEYR